MVRMTSTTDTNQPQASTERTKYNPALSSRNIEATKWFGQPTAQDKIWMRRSGKIDESAEEERRKLIKSMSKRHAPKRAPKWQPPKEQDIAEKIDGRPKQSLLDYENRRKMKMSKINEITLPVEANAPLTTMDQCSSENIIVESVVHSKDAVSIWESRLSEKQHKEELERQRLSVGKGKVRRERCVSETIRHRHDSDSSVCSTRSAVLPTSEHIEKESVEFSKVRDRWQVISQKSEPPVPKEKIRSITGSSISLISSSRESLHDIGHLSITSDTYSTDKSIPENESFVDREIREAAEREERWKEEQRELKRLSSCENEADVTQFPSQLEPQTCCDKDKSITLYPKTSKNETLHFNEKEKRTAKRKKENGTVETESIVTPATDNSNTNVQLVQREIETLGTFGSIVTKDTDETTFSNSDSSFHCVEKEQPHIPLLADPSGSFANSMDESETTKANESSSNCENTAKPSLVSDQSISDSFSIDEKMQSVAVRQDTPTEITITSTKFDHDFELVHKENKKYTTHNDLNVKATDSNKMHVQSKAENTESSSEHRNGSVNSLKIGTNIESDISTGLLEGFARIIVENVLSSTMQTIAQDQNKNNESHKLEVDIVSKDKASYLDITISHNDCGRTDQENSERKQRIAALTSVMSPRGWQPGKGSAIRPVSSAKSPTTKGLKSPEPL